MSTSAARYRYVFARSEAVPAQAIAERSRYVFVSMSRTRMPHQMGMTRVHRGMKMDMVMTTKPNGGATMVMNLNPVMAALLGRALDDDEMPRTPPRASRRAASPLSQKDIYRAVAKTVGSTPVMVKQVTDATMTVAAMQLKSDGPFTIAGKLKMKLKTHGRHVATSMKGTHASMKQIVRVSPLKKFKEMVNCPCPDAD